MPVSLLSRRLGAMRRTAAEIDALTSDEGRYIDQRVEFRTHPFEENPITGACMICGGGGHGQRVLLSAGGRWDRLLRRFSEGQPSPVLRECDLVELLPHEVAALCPPHVFIVTDSQVDYVLAFGDWLWAFLHDKPRPTALDVLAGNRRGGKTFIMIACVLAAALACPITRRGGKDIGFLGWFVVATYPEQREIHEDLAEVLRRRGDSGPDPSTWFTYRAKDNLYTSIAGATLVLKSANDPESLKQGRVDIVGINESQKVDGDAAIHTAGNNIDLGGLTILAANPPRKVKGAWMLDIKAAWEKGRNRDPEDGQEVIRWFWINPEGNPHVSQAGRRKFKFLAAIINPKLGAADADNEWNQINDVVCPKWGYDLVLEEIPGNWENVTGEVIRAMGLRDYIRRPETFISFGGLDFNKSPHMAAVRWEAFRDPTARDPQKVIFVAIAELTSNPESDKGHTEKEFIGELWERGWRPEEVFFIGDPSGQWQSSEHRKRGGVKQGHSSFDLFRSPTEVEINGQVVQVPAWDIFAPTTWRLKESLWYAHPRKLESIDDMNELMRTRRLRVLSSCPALIEAFAKCSTKNHGPNSEHWHIFDAARYPIHRALNGIEPKKRPATRGGGGVARRGGGGRGTVGFGGRGGGGGGKMFGG